jgi:hypothetical protein
VKEKLGLVLEPAHLPFHVINMFELGGVVPTSSSLRHDVLLGNLAPNTMSFLDPKPPAMPLAPADEMIEREICQHTLLQAFLARPGNSLRCNEFGSYWESS